MSKRQKRPVDKFIIAIKTEVRNSQDVQTLLDLTYPCTIVGIAWQLEAHVNSIIAGRAGLKWAFNIQRDGATQLLIAPVPPTGPRTNFLTNGSTSDVIISAFQRPQFSEVTTTDLTDHIIEHTVRHEGSTKAMRKLTVGDTLQMTAISDISMLLGGVIVSGVITIWIKA